MGMMVERLKHEGTSHSSSDLLKLIKIIPLCYSDLLFQCVFGLFIQDFIPLPVSIFFGLTELSEFCSEPWFVIAVG